VAFHPAGGDARRWSRRGTAYADLAGLCPVTCLYTSIMCYPVMRFSSSRILVLGPDSSLRLMIAATILPLMAAGGDEKARHLRGR